MVARVAAARVVTPSLPKMLTRWELTVRGLRNRATASSRSRPTRGGRDINGDGVVSTRPPPEEQQLPKTCSDFRGTEIVEEEKGSGWPHI